MRRTMLGLGMMAFAAIGTGEARAQAPSTGGETVVYETVAPASRSVTYGERVKVRQKRFKTVIKERPVAYVTRTPAVVRETRFVQPPPIVENVVVQPPPVVESRVVQPAPMIETRVIRSRPEVQTRYLPGPPY